jgi:prepilin-type N-terminal cleavage/methylation domain-containing protein
MKMPVCRAHSSQGFSLIELLITVAIFGVLVMIGVDLMQMSSSTMSKISRESVLNDVRMELISRLQTDIDFEKTLRHPGNAVVFDCILRATDCRDAGGEFKIFDRNNTTLTYASLSSEPTIGFDRNGAICNSFDSSSGGNCAYKYVATWLPICPPAHNIQGRASIETLCRNPIIDVRVRLTVAGSGATPGSAITSLSINKDLAEVRVTRAQIGSDPKKLCAMLGNMVFDGARCVAVNLADYTCEAKCEGGLAPGFVIGINADGTPKCECAPIQAPADLRLCNGTLIGVGRVVVGVNADATVTCQDGLVPYLENSGAIYNSGGDGGSG